ncbi:MAG: sensor histidine kinase [Thermoleophilia bacterium]
MTRLRRLLAWLPRPRDWIIPAALAIAIEAEIAFGAIHGPVVLAAVCGAVGALSLAWRGRAPIPVAIIAALALCIPLLAGVPGNDGVFSVFPILFAMFALGQASQADPGARRAGYATIVAVIALAWTTSIAEAGLAHADYIYIGAFAVAPYLFGRAVGASRRDSERNARRAVAEERLRIARELHDVISHSVSLMGIQAGAARTVLPSGLDDVEVTLRSIESTARETLDEMRRLLGVMREGDEDGAARAPQPGVGAIQDLVARTRESGVPVRLTRDGEMGDVPPGPELVAFRIVQEALTNVRRHAPGSGAEVRVSRLPAALVIDVGNDLPSGAAGRPRADGHGIIGMRERVALYDGEFAAGPRDGRFVVSATLPLDRARSAGPLSAREPA